MKIRAKVVILVAAALFIAALVAVPRIIEARRSNAAGINNQPTAAAPVQGRSGEVQHGVSVRNDTSIPLREMKQKPMDFRPER